MIGIVLVGHCRLADEFLAVVRSIVGNVEHICSVFFEPQEGPDISMKKVARAIQQVNKGKGVLILTDMFGGTPSNMSLSFLKDGSVEVVTGLNLPMLIRLITLRENGADLVALARDLTEYGRRNIYIASDILSKGKDA